MKISTLILLLLTSVCKLFSQNIIFIGDNSYPATQTWFFEGNGSQFQYYAKDASIQVGRKGTTGVLLISTLCYSAASGIKGSINIYLSNGDRVTLSTVIAKDFVDSYSNVIYNLSSENITKLMQNDIQVIRFNTASGGSLEGHTIDNKYDSNPDPIVNKQEKWNTAADIKELFEKN